MAQDYDVALKLLFRTKSSQAVREIAGGPMKRWLDKELPAIRNTRVDLLGETVGGDFVHLEFMSENQTLFEWWVIMLKSTRRWEGIRVRRWLTWGARSCV